MDARNPIPAGGLRGAFGGKQAGRLSSIIHISLIQSMSKNNRVGKRLTLTGEQRAKWNG